MNVAPVFFAKYQALGNDYVVLMPAAAGRPAAAGLAPDGVLRPESIRRICDRHLGVGSDGVLVETQASDGNIGLRIFNPDGSEAEKSGNGLRIFARHLWDSGRVGDGPFRVTTAGGMVTCSVLDAGRTVRVEMGQASFDSERIPVAGPRREVVEESLTLAGELVRFTAVTVGNPHCVVFRGAVAPELAFRLGPLLENHPIFPNRTNVQFVQVCDRHRLRLEIWERGAGYTLASGSSSCAAAAASVRVGLCEGDVAVEMPGGTLQIGVEAGFDLTMQGPAEKIASGTLSEELLAHLVAFV